MSKFGKGGEYFEAINGVWNFFKENSETKTTEEWIKVANSVEKFKTPLEQDLILAIINEIERTVGNVK